MPNGQAASQIHEEDAGCLSRVLNCPALGRRCRRSSVYVSGVFTVHRKSLNGEKSPPLPGLKRGQTDTELKSEKSESPSPPSSAGTSTALPSAQTGYFSRPLGQAGARRFQGQFRHPLGGWQDEDRLRSPRQESPNPKQLK